MSKDWYAQKHGFRPSPPPTPQPAPQAELDFDSDEPLPVCPMRNNGDDICESCQ